MTRRDAFGNCGLLGMLAALWPWGGKRRPPKHDFTKVVRDAMAAYRVRGYPMWVRVRYHTSDDLMKQVHGVTPGGEHLGTRYEAEDGIALRLVQVSSARLQVGGWVTSYHFKRDAWLDRFGNLVDDSPLGGFPVPPKVREALYRLNPTLRMKGA